ncbi:MAG: hypothetical protein GY947_14810 [Rhodobacteraceae bacterium]|nr:hypothetical protein [Paracoccaceae bacterium]
MPKFGLIYRGGKPFETPEEGKAHMENWRAWAEGLGSAYVYPGMPFSSANIVNSDGVTEGSGDVPMTGISVIEAETMDDAIKMAKACPHIKIGGEIVVAQGIDMEM